MFSGTISRRNSLPLVRPGFQATGDGRIGSEVLLPCASEGVLDRCAALILPLRTGGGSRLKALIALASGVPIVSTRVGMEGLEAEPDVHYLAAESPLDWVSALQRLLEDIALRQRLARAGRQLVEQQYDWSAIQAEVHAAYEWLGR